MRRTVLLATTSLFCVTLLHCVGDVPSGQSSSDAGASDGSADSGASDASTNNDGSDGSSGPVDACAGFTDCPTSVQTADVMLWLRGNFGLNCISKRISTWSDQSGHHRDATPAQRSPVAGDALTPQCGVATIGGQEVATFTAPPEEDAGDQTKFVDETMTVDLSWVDGTDYTLFIVHRRAADGVFTMVGNDGTNASLCDIFSGTVSNMSALELGFSALGDGGNALTIAHECAPTQTNGAFVNAPSDSFAAGTVEVDEAVFSTTAGIELFANGVNVAGATFKTDKNALQDAGLPGFVGRGYTAIGTDTRYQGDIAEIIGYDLALADDDRAKIETYLKRQWRLTF